MAAIFFFGYCINTPSKQFACNFKLNSSDILFHSSSIAVLSEPIFGWEVVLFSKTLHIE